MWSQRSFMTSWGRSWASAMWYRWDTCSPGDLSATTVSCLEASQFHSCTSPPHSWVCDLWENPWRGTFGGLQIYSLNQQHHIMETIRTWQMLTGWMWFCIFGPEKVTTGGTLDLNDNSDCIAVVKEVETLFLFKYKQCLSYVSDYWKYTFLGFKCLLILSGILLSNDICSTITQPVKESQAIAYAMFTLFQFVHSEPLGTNSLLSFLSTYCYIFEYKSLKFSAVIALYLRASVLGNKVNSQRMKIRKV